MNKTERIRELSKRINDETDFVSRVVTTPRKIKLIIVSFEVTIEFSCEPNSQKGLDNIIDHAIEFLNNHYKIK